MKFCRVIAFLFCSFVVMPFSVKAHERDLLVFAAASTYDAMLKIGKAYEETCDCKVTFSFASSAVLSRQIDVGAQADIIISANRQWIDWLEEREKLRGEALPIASNRLVIASTALTKDSFNILFRNRFSMGDPNGVPSGIYAKQALTSMGLWEDVKSNAVFTENVRVALSMISRGDLQSGIVYASDLIASSELHAHFRFPENTHDPIKYLASTVKSSEQDTVYFLQFLKSDVAQSILKEAGFLKVGK